MLIESANKKKKKDKKETIFNLLQSKLFEQLYLMFSYSVNTDLRDLTLSSDSDQSYLF